MDALKGEILAVVAQSVRTSPLVVDWYGGRCYTLTSCFAFSVSIRSRFVVPGRGEEGEGEGEGEGSSKSGKERFGGLGRGDLDSIEETPGMSRQP